MRGIFEFVQNVPHVHQRSPVIPAFISGGYGVLYAVAGVWAIIGAVVILPVKRVR